MKPRRLGIVALTWRDDPRTRSGTAWLLDAAVGLVAAVLSVVLASGPGPSVTLKAVVLIAMLVPLLVRRVHPLGVLAWCVGVALVFGWWSLPAVSAPALIVALYTVAATSRWFVAVAAACLLQAGDVLASWRTTPETWWAPAIAFGVFVVGATVLGLYVGKRRELLDQARARGMQLEVERDEQAELAAVAERHRIALEMHDIVAHHLTVMVALSDGASATAPTAPERAAEVMQTVSSTGREALADTRRLLGVLAAGGDERQPAPGLADLDALLARVRDAGLPTTCVVDPDLPTLSPGTQLAIYRLVQESLTNTMKHAGPDATATVTIGPDDDSVRVVTADDGDGGDTATGAGRGLVGIGERVRAAGGDVVFGPRDGGGWQVDARLPAGSS